MQKNNHRPKNICVIGAGSSGLASVKALTEAGFEPDCFEMGTKVGGLWAIDNDNGRGGAYESLHINTSAKAMEFSDFPMPDELGDFPSHTGVAAYFRSYSDRFGMASHIHFNKEVVKCKQEGAGYSVHARDSVTAAESDHDYDAVIVANGHHWSPAFPPRATFESFEGKVLHAADYVTPDRPHDFSGDRVLVVGMGNSAMDIASELSKSKSSCTVTVSARRGAWVLPKYILGKPLDQGRVIPAWLPEKLRRRVVTWSFRMLHGSMESYGLPQPDHLIGEAHPTVSSEFPELVKSGAIAVRSGFSLAQGKTVTFSDGKTDDFDSIVFCTGYDVKFPFLDKDHVSAPDNCLPLYHRAFHLDHRRLFFVGLAQTVGAIMPVAEAQARVIAAHLKGDYNLPSREEMERIVGEEEREMRARFVSSRRHTMQVIPERFLAKLERDLRAGAVRAQKGQGIAFAGTTH